MSFIRMYICPRLTLTMSGYVIETELEECTMKRGGRTRIPAIGHHKTEASFRRLGYFFEPEVFSQC